MAYNTKSIVADVDGNPISQYYNKSLDKYEPVEGQAGANKAILYNSDGTENNELSLIPILDKLSQLTGTVIDEEVRKSNELQRIALYNLILQMLDDGELTGEKGDKGDRGDTGLGLEFNWQGTSLGVRIEGEIDYVYVDLKGESGDIDNLNASDIQNALKDTGLVLENDTHIATVAPKRLNVYSKETTDFIDVGAQYITFDRQIGDNTGITLLKARPPKDAGVETITLPHKTGEVLLKEDIANDLTTITAGHTLDARQGKILKDDLDEHKAESVYELIRPTRDASLTGIQTITLSNNKIPKRIEVMALVSGASHKWSLSLGTGTTNTIYPSASAGQVTYRATGESIAIANDLDNRTLGEIKNIRKGAFDIEWKHTGTGATGTIWININVTYHD